MKETSLDFKFGYLQGEIIWLSKLSRYTECQLMTKIALDEEKVLYQQQTDTWYNSISTLPKEETDNLFKIHRDYANSLISKYFLHEIEYTTWCHYKITDIDEFYEGIRCFLWDTDNCCYDFNLGDIKFEFFELWGKLLKINFRLTK